MEKSLFSICLPGIYASNQKFTAASVAPSSFSPNWNTLKRQKVQQCCTEVGASVKAFVHIWRKQMLFDTNSDDVSLLWGSCTCCCALEQEVWLTGRRRWLIKQSMITTMTSRGVECVERKRTAPLSAPGFLASASSLQSSFHLHGNPRKIHTNVVDETLLSRADWWGSENQGDPFLSAQAINATSRKVLH